MEEFLKINSGNKKSLCQSSQTQALQTFYSDQITYSFTPMSSRFLDHPRHLDQNFDNRNTSSSLAEFTSTCILQLHIYMVQTLKILETNINNKNNDELNTFK